MELYRSTSRVVEVEKGETLAYAVEASASTAIPTKKRQLRVKNRQQEGTEPDKGTVRDRNRRVQPTPGEQSTDRKPWSTVPATVRTTGETRERKVPGEERPGEDGRAKEPATKRQCGNQGWPSNSMEL